MATDTIKNGKVEVFEVFERSDAPAQYFPTEEHPEGEPYPQPVIQRATFWDREQAGLFLSALTGRELRPEVFETTCLGGYSGQKRTPIVVVDGLAVYDVRQEPVPTDLIHTSAAEAAQAELSARPELAETRPALVELAGQASLNGASA